jgi:hypothetical protein
VVPTRRAVTVLLIALVMAACNPVDRSVRAWIESRDAKGSIIAGATVEIDGQEVGMTDQRGLYRVKIRRRVGEKVSLKLYDAAPRQGAPTRAWTGAFTVNSAGNPSETDGGRVVAILSADGAS